MLSHYSTMLVATQLSTGSANQNGVLTCFGLRSIELLYLTLLGAGSNEIF